MRRGNQFDFTKLDNPDKPSNDQKQGETIIGQQIVFESKRNLNDPRGLKKRETLVSVTMLSSSSGGMHSSDNDD